MSDNLYAIVDDAEMEGDSIFECPTSNVRYSPEMTFEDVVEKCKNQTFNEILADYADEIMVAWIVDQKTMDALKASIPECWNDTQAYTANRTLKAVASNLCLKRLSRKE